MARHTQQGDDRVRLLKQLEALPWVEDTDTGTAAIRVEDIRKLFADLPASSQPPAPDLHVREEMEARIAAELKLQVMAREGGDTISALVHGDVAKAHKDDLALFDSLSSNQPPDQVQLGERELLEQAAKAIRDTLKILLTLKGTLEQPYPDDDRWSPWTRWIDRNEYSPWSLLVKADTRLRIALNEATDHSDPADKGLAVYDARANAEEARDQATGHSESSGEEGRNEAKHVVADFCRPDFGRTR